MAIVPILLLLWYVGGTARRIQMEHYQKGLPTIRVANLQTNAPLDRAQEQLVTPEVIHRIVYRTVPRLAEEAERAGEGRVDLFVLPEAGIPFLTTDRNPFTEQAGLYSPDLDRMLRMIAYNYNAEVMLNEVALRAEPGLLDRRLELNAYNTATVFSRDGVRRATYDKMELVAFGEYIPGVDFLIKSGLIRFLPAAARMGRFTPGRIAAGLPFSRGNTEQRPELPLPFTLDSLSGIDPDAFTSSFSSRRNFTREGTFIPLICYEILFPSHVRDFFQTGNPGFMVNITQDGWYGDSIETFQHFELGHVRAVEFRRAIARSTNNGASGYADIAGNFVDPLAGPRFTPRNVETFQVWDVPINKAPPTVYARIGNNWILPLYLLAFVWFGYRTIRRKYATAAAERKRDP